MVPPPESHSIVKELEVTLLTHSAIGSGTAGGLPANAGTRREDAGMERDRLSIEGMKD